MARWLIQCGGSDVTGKIKMDIISGEKDRDGEGVCREGWEEEVGVYSVWVGQTSFGMGFGEDLLFQLVIIFPRMSHVREENTVLLCFEIGTTPSTIFLHLCGGRCWLSPPVQNSTCPPRSPHGEPGRDLWQTRQRTTLAINSADWLKSKRGGIYPGSLTAFSYVLKAVWQQGFWHLSHIFGMAPLFGLNQIL